MKVLHYRSHAMHIIARLGGALGNRCFNTRRRSLAARTGNRSMIDGTESMAVAAAGSIDDTVAGYPARHRYFFGKTSGTCVHSSSVRS
jgi:hypothetical protein